MKIYVVMHEDRLVGVRSSRDGARALALETVSSNGKAPDHRWHQTDLEADAHGQARPKEGTTGERTELVTRVSRKWSTTGITIDTALLDN